MKKNYLFSNKNKKINGPFFFNPDLFVDERGYFMESWNQETFNKLINININFVQDNHSFSQKGVLRGLHYQTKPEGQGKLIRCINGKVFDVIVDIRKNSNTFGQWASVTLSKSNKSILWIPEGFAHGFLTLSKNAEVIYKTSNFWSPECEKTILWNDPSIGINWPLDKNKYIISKKDKCGENLLSLSNNLLF